MKTLSNQQICQVSGGCGIYNDHSNITINIKPKPNGDTKITITIGNNKDVGIFYPPIDLLNEDDFKPHPPYYIPPQPEVKY